MTGEQDLSKFMIEFQTEADCIDFFHQAKWPSGFICPRCDQKQAYTIHSRRLPLYQCTYCSHQTSLTVNTVMEGSRTSLRKWLIALFLMSRISAGISALQLSKIINVTYKTAWLMLHKIRHAMTEADASVKLCGMVQVNDTWSGHTRHSSYIRHPHEYPLLIGAIMTNQTTPAFIKMKAVADEHFNDYRILQQGKEDFIHDSIETDGSTVEFVLGRSLSAKCKKLSPLFRMMNRWLQSTFHGVTRRHLQAYVNEYCYRFNIHQKTEGIFQQLARLCANSRAVSYTALTW